MKKEMITFSLDPEKTKALDAIATSMDRDRAYILNEAVEEYIELRQWYLSHIQKGLDQADKGDFASEEDVEKFLAFLHGRRKWSSSLE
ncbi:MAG: CopG family transcriptional regulator [Alphaproteobacteria bacterium 41-28]|nr:MAG: CopG family transcriptional regulator [Alphaproteobacteria bacterium 41-28]